MILELLHLFNKKKDGSEDKGGKPSFILTTSKYLFKWAATGSVKAVLLKTLVLTVLSAAIITSPYYLTQGAYLYATYREVPVFVDDKERVDGIYKVWDGVTADVIRVQDSWWFGATKAGTTYGQLKRGKNCIVGITGFRNGLLSLEPNVVKVLGCTDTK